MCYTKSDAVNTWKAIYFIKDTITNRINSKKKKKLVYALSMKKRLLLKMTKLLTR